MGAYGSPEFEIPKEENNEVIFADQNYIYCQKCGTYYSKKHKKCPRCKTKYSQAFFHKWWFWILVVIVIAAYIPVPTTENTISTYNEKPIISKEEYIVTCIELPYEDVARNPNKYIDTNAVFTGKVVQVQENNNNIMFRVDVTKNAYGIWSNTIYVDYRRKTENESRILENDIITIYGKMNGIKNYTSVMGNQISIPHIIAEYIDIN